MSNDAKLWKELVDFNEKEVPFCYRAEAAKYMAYVLHRWDILEMYYRTQDDAGYRYQLMAEVSKEA